MDFGICKGVRVGQGVGVETNPPADTDTRR